MNSRDEPAAARGRDKDVARQGGTGAQAPKGRVSDESLVRELYAEHAAPLLRYALRMTDGDRQRAEDIVQETLFRAWQHPEAIAERPARPWLFAVARKWIERDCPLDNVAYPGREIDWPAWEAMKHVVSV